MTVKVARCPHCNSRFRVNLDLLGIAAGAVRCGNCLQVFQADQHIVKVIESDAPLSNTEQLPAADTLDSHQQNEVSTSETQGSATNLGITNRQLSDDAASPPSATTTPAEQYPLSGDKDHTDGFDRIISDAEKVSTDATPDTEEIKAPLSYTTNVRLDESSTTDSTTDSTTNDTCYNPVISEPLSVEELPRRWPWGIGIMVAIIILAAQITTLHFDHGARSPQWRPFYSQLCETVGCQLPSPHDVSLIESQHLIIRPHPTSTNALMVDTLLVNQADWPQPYPDLLLEFRDINGQAVAARRFTPTDYLPQRIQMPATPTKLDTENAVTDTDQAQETIPLMPSSVAVHIALQIINPGDQATAYELIPMVNQTR